MRSGGRAVTRWLLAAFYLAAAWFHLTAPDTFLKIMPGWVPWPEATVIVTGLVEGMAALALIQPWSRLLCKAGGVGLALYAIVVFPANITHFALDMAKPDHGWGLAYHLPRMAAQPILVWLALWASGVVDWPWRYDRRVDRAGPLE